MDQAMTREVVRVSPDCPLEEAATLMVKHKIGSLPVVESEQVIGIITENKEVFYTLSVMVGSVLVAAFGAWARYSLPTAVA